MENICKVNLHIDLQFYIEIDFFFFFNNFSSSKTNKLKAKKKQIEKSGPQMKLAFY